MQNTDNNSTRYINFNKCSHGDLGYLWHLAYFLKAHYRILNYGIAIKEIGCVVINVSDYASLHSRRLEVVGARKNVHARGEGTCLPLVWAFFLAPTTSRVGYDYARDSLETKKLCCYHKFGQSMKIADISQPHHWFWKHSPQNDILGMSTEISYWWQVTTQIWVVLLIGCAAWQICYNQSEGLPISGW